MRWFECEPFNFSNVYKNIKFSKNMKTFYYLFLDILLPTFVIVSSMVDNVFVLCNKSKFLSNSLLINDLFWKRVHFCILIYSYVRLMVISYSCKSKSAYVSQISQIIDTFNYPLLPQKWQFLKNSNLKTQCNSG